METKLYLSLTTHSTLTKKPIYKIFVNGNIVDLTPVVETLSSLEEQHHYVISVDKLNTVDIEFVNKLPNDTVVEKDGKITQDLFLVISQLKVDSFNLLDILSKISVYKDIKGKIWKTHTFMSFTGKMRIKIHKNLLYTDWLAGLL